MSNRDPESPLVVTFVVLEKKPTCLNPDRILILTLVGALVVKSA